MVHWHSDLALLDVLIFPFRAGQTKRREVSFISAFVLFFFCFVFIPPEQPQGSPLEHLTVAGPGESRLVHAKS